MAPHSSILAWRIPGMREPGGLPSMGLHRVRHDWSDLAVAAIPEFLQQNLPIQLFLKIYQNWNITGRLLSFVGMWCFHSKRIISLSCWEINNTECSVFSEGFHQIWWRILNEKERQLQRLTPTDNKSSLAMLWEGGCQSPEVLSEQS